MPTRTISTKLAIEGESQYRQAVQSINSTYSQLNSQLKLVESEFQNQQNTLTALQAKEKALADIQSTLSQKVQTCKEAYSNAQSAMSTYKAKIDDLKGALEKNKTALDGMDSATKKSGQQWLSYKTQIDEAEAKLKVLASTSGDTSAEEEKLRQEIDQARAAMDKLEDETGGAAKTAGELLQEQRNLSTEMDKAEAGYSACEKACSSWKKQETDAQIALNNTNAELERNGKYLDEAKKSSDGCAKSIDEFGNSTEKSQSALQGLASVLAGAALKRAIKEMAEAFNECVDASAEFASQMSTVKAISGATQSEMQQLTDLAKEMGATTKFTATEAGQGLEYMAMAGWKADEMLDGLAGIMNLAAAAGEDLGRTSDIVTDALTAFGLTAADSAHFSDVLAQAAANSNTNVTMMGESFKMVATTAGSLNYSIDDVAVALGAMANQGLKSEMAGTALATALTRMSGTNDKATQAMDKLGLSMFDVATGKSKALSVFLDELREAFSGLNQQQVVNYAYMLAGQKGMKGLQAIINTSEADWEKLTAAIAGCNGAAELMAQTKLDNYAGQVTLLKSAFDALTVSIGDVLTPVLGDMAEAATSALNWMNDVVKNHPSVVAAVVAVTVAIAALVAGAVTMTVVIPAVTAAWTAMTTAMKANSIGLVITAVTAAVAAIGTFIAVLKSHHAAQMVSTNAAKAFNETLEEQKEAFTDLQAETASTIETTNALATSVINLANSAATSKADHDALLSTIEQLNEAVPGLNLAFDEQTGTLNKTTEEILAQVDAHNQLSEAQTKQERYNELLLDQSTIQNKITESETAIAEAQERYNQLLDESPLNYFNSEAKDCRKTIADKEEAVRRLNESLEDVNGELEQLGPEIDAFASSQENASEAIQAATNIANNLAEALVELQDRYDEAYDAAIESIEGQASLWDTLDETVAMSTSDIMGAIESQISYWQNYNSNLENLLNRNVDGLSAFVASVDDGSEKAAAYIAGMVNMTDAELEELVGSYAELRDAQRNTAGSMADMATQYSSETERMVMEAVAQLQNLNQSEEMRQAALDTLEGYIAGLDEETDSVDEELKTVAQSAIDMFKTELDSHSPSRVFEQIGSDTLAGYINGLNGQQGNTQSTLQTLAQLAISVFRGSSNSSTLRGSGSDTVSGYISGVNGQSSNATSTLQRLAQSATSAFKGISNNSALQGSGSDTISGYVSGVNGQTSSMTNKMRSMAQSAINAMKNNATSSSLYSAGLNTIQGFINGAANKASSLYSTLASMASNALSRFKSVLGIHSPSTEFASAGQFTVAGFVKGVKQKQATVQDTMAAMAKNASDSFRSSLDYDVDGAKAAAYGTSAAGASDARNAGQGINLKLEFPIYINGQYTKREIVEIAREGIGRQMMNLNAAKGGFV